MRVLTVQQPWAWAIFHGKDVENRTQLFKYRGPLAIHAGARWSERGGQFSGLPHVTMTPFLTAHQRRRPLDPAEHPDRFHFRAILGTVDLVGAHYECGGTCSAWGERSNPHADEKAIVHLELENAREFETPIPNVKGKLGLWAPDADLLDAIKAAA